LPSWRQEEDDLSRVARPRTKGFWRVVITGLLLAAAAAIGLTIAYPPMVFTRPVMTPGNELAPNAPEQPGGGTVPELETGRDWLLIPRADAPLITGRPEAETPPGLEGLAPFPAPSVFDGGSTGSPSLVTPTGH
jgi:hypothetical protein